MLYTLYKIYLIFTVIIASLLLIFGGYALFSNGYWCGLFVSFIGGSLLPIAVIVGD